MFTGAGKDLDHEDTRDVTVECDEDTCIQVQGYQGFLDGAQKKAAKKIEEVNS